MGSPVPRNEHQHGRVVGPPLTAAALVAVVFGTLASSGCRSGATAMSAPSWWSFGGAKPSDTEKLAAAPPFEGSIKKPSESAAPYPTTTTPNGYAVSDAAAGPAAQPVSPPSLAATEPAAITYGSQPTPAAVAAAAPSTAVTAPPAQPSAAAIAPQVGPYASLTGSQPSASMAAVPSSAPPATPFSAAPPPSPTTSGAFPATAGYEPAPPARPAEPYGLGGPPAAPQAPGSAMDPASRYASVPGSRFGGASFTSPPASPPLEPAMSAMPSAAALPASAPPLSASPPPLVTPPSSTSLPPAAPSLPATPALPGAPPPPTAPATPPPRRPDPGYRPAGTSSYRPTRAILVDNAPATPSAVRTASFETPVLAAP